jgi:hypothetical protein
LGPAAILDAALEPPAELFDDPARGEVFRQRERDHVGEVGPGEADIEERPRDLGGEAPAPILKCGRSQGG